MNSEGAVKPARGTQIVYTAVVVFIAVSLVCMGAYSYTKNPATMVAAAASGTMGALLATGVALWAGASRFATKTDAKDTKDAKKDGAAPPAEAKPAPAKPADAKPAPTKVAGVRATSLRGSRGK